MGRLFKWDLVGLVNTKKFKGMFGFMFVLALAYIGIAYVDDIRTGMEFFIGSCDFVVSTLYIVGAVFAGSYMTAAFQERMIQSAVMSGHSRIQVVLSKSLVYLGSMLVFILIPVVVTSVIFTIIFGFGQAVTGESIVFLIRVILLSLLVNLASMSVCIPISFFAKSIGSSIGINVAVILLWYGITQSFVTNEKVFKILSFTTMGQSFLVYGDMTSADVIKAVVISFITIIVCLAITYFKFDKEELK